MSRTEQVMPALEQSVLSQAEESEFQKWQRAQSVDSVSIDEDSLRAYWKNQELPRQGVVRYSGEGLSPEDYDPDIDDYGGMVKAGFTHKEVREYLGPRLAACGFTDSEIHEHFQQQAAPAFGVAAKYGWQSSWLGMKTGEKLPDALEPEEIEAMGLPARLVSQTGTLAGDAIPMLVGGLIGSLGGPAAPVTIPAGAFGVAEGWKAAVRDEIEHGPINDLGELVARAKNFVPETLKGVAVGGVTGGAGALALGTAAKAGLGIAGQTAAKLGAETLAMPTAAAGLEGRLPTPQEFADAAVLVTAMHVGGAAVGTSGRKVMRAARDIAPKLEEITARTGRHPMDVVKEAEADPTIKQDILSCNRDMPGKFAEDTLNRLKAGEEVPTEELQGYKNLSWAQAIINERAGAEAVQAKIGNMAEKAAAETPPQESLHWSFIRPEEAAALSQKTGTEITPGFTHVVDASALRHAIKEHGNPATEIPRGQLPITAEDLARIPEVIRDHDAVVHAGKNKIGRDVIRYAKTLDAETVMVVEEVRTKRNHLAFQTMWKKKAIDASPPSLTSETLRGMSTTSNAGEVINGLSDIIDTLSGAEVKPDVLARQSGGTFVPVDPAKPALPEGALSAAEAVRMSDIVASLEKVLAAPIRTGKMGPSGRGAEGIYKVAPEVIRTRVANDIATIVHEAGHHIQKQLYGDISWKPLAPFRDELAPMATKPRAGQSSLPEGFAEYVAKSVVNPAEAARMAPRFTAHFQEMLAQKAPELKAALDAARENVKRWAEQPAALEVLSHISVGDREGPGLLARALQKETWDTVYTNVVDRLYPLKKATEIMAAGEELPADKHPYILARTFSGAKGKATHFIQRSPFRFDTWENVGKPLTETLRAVENMDEFRAYLVSRRGLEIESQGKKAGPRPEAMKATAEALRDKYEPLAKEIGEYQDHLVNYLVDAGLVDKEAAALMREMNQRYVPFFRVMEEGGGLMAGKKNLQGRNPLKRLKGSGRDIVDPIESVIKNTYAYIEAAEKNAVGKALAGLAEKSEGAGWLMEKLPTPKEAVRVGAEDVKKAFLKSLGETDPAMRNALQLLLSSEGMEGLATFWQNARNIDKKNQIAVYREGKREVWQVDPEIARVFHDLEPETIPLFVKLMAVPARLLRAGATLTPEFMVRNLIRDAVSAGVLSRSGFIPGLDTARGLKRAVTRGDAYWNWVKAGGDQASLVSMDRTTLQKNLTDITATGYAEKVWNLVKNPVEALRLVSELSEQTTRLGEFGKATQKFGTDKAGQMRAAYEARDLMDFARRGRLTRNFNMITAFFNAQLQGLDRMARGAMENPKRFLVGAAVYIAIPSIINAVRNHGDERVREVPRAQRDMFWIVPVGEGENTALVRIPKPFESGVLFGSAVERATEFLLDAYTDKYKGDINKARQEAFRGLGASLWDVTKPSIIPNAAQPFIEAFANRSLTFDRPIIPRDRESMLPEYQYAPYTTELSKALSRLFGTLPPVGEMNTFSPARAEHFIRSWTGGLGMYALQAVDAMGRSIGALPDPVKPADTLADIPFVRAFVIRHPSMGAESIQRFYDQYDEAQKYLKTINGLQKEFKYDDVANLLPYAAYSAIEGPRQALSGINKTIGLINKHPDMNADEKRQLLDAAYFQAVEVARQGNRAFEALKKDIAALKERAAKDGR